MSARSRTASIFQRLTRRAVLARLEGLRRGRITIVDHDERWTFGGAADGVSLAATIHVTNPAFWTAVATSGSVGAGGSYIDGHWTADDLTTLMRIMVLNRDVLNGVEGGLARLSAPLFRAYHHLRRNTRGGSRRNIEEHYDLSNDFFETFLDETMTYSCGVYEHPGATLRDASVLKYDRICRKLQLEPHHHLLEIGTGWGGFAIHAARHFGCRVTTTTISGAQHALAVQRVKEAGLEDRITLLERDYRDLDGRYDRLVSIEMIEAVGHAYYDEYFRVCSERLKADGMMLLQAITIADQHYRQALRSVDYIQRYIFPGSCIPSIEVMTSSVARATDMKLFHLEDIGPHYSTTIRAWRERLLEQRDRIAELGFDERMLRRWEFYFAYCEGGFEERAIGTVQALLTKPMCRREPALVVATPALVTAS